MSTHLRYKYPKFKAREEGIDDGGRKAKEERRKLLSYKIS
jgi:hypothetical protein